VVEVGQIEQHTLLAGVLDREGMSPMRESDPQTDWVLGKHRGAYASPEHGGVIMAKGEGGDNRSGLQTISKGAQSGKRARGTNPLAGQR